jgi:putative ABC transport system permease protein
MGSFLQDLRYGWRMLGKNPGFTVMAVVTLAAGIGATTAIFSVVDAVMIRALPFRDPEQLVALWEKDAHYDMMSVAGPNYVDWAGESSAFSALAAGAIDDPTVTGFGDPEHLYGIQVTPNFFQVLGLNPAIGRAFVSGEDQPGKDHVAILGYSTWHRKFGGDLSIVGKDITLDGEKYAVIGIMPGTFRFPQIWGITDPYVYLPFTVTRLNQHRENRWIWVLGRMKPGVTIAQTRAEMSTIAARLAQQYPETNKGAGVSVIPMHEEVEHGTGPLLMILLGAVAMMLLIACANVANMQLARMPGRQREMAVRLTMGASRLRVVRQLLTESVLLALAGAGVGIYIATALKQALVATSPEGMIPTTNPINLNSWVLGFSAALAMASGIFFGLAPALQAGRTNIQESLKEGARSTAGTSSRRMRSALVVAQVALTLILLIGAGLLMRSLRNLANSPLGFESSHVITMNTSLPQRKYPKPAQCQAFEFEALRRLRGLPGVAAAAFTTSLPVGWGWSGDVQVEGKPAETESSEPMVLFGQTTPGYFEVFDIPLVLGRGFTESDYGESAHVAVVNQAFARHYWPSENPLGKQFRIRGESSAWRTVVGVSRDVSQEGPYRSVHPQAFFPDTPRTPTLVVRTRLSPQSLTRAIEAQLWSVDRDLPLYEVATMEEVREMLSGAIRYPTRFIASFAFLSFLLACGGIYAVVAYTVSLRTHEIGIRMALGARGADVLKLVVAEGMMPTAIGVILGGAGALLVTRLLGGFMNELLYGVRPTDPGTFIGLSLGLGCVALIASYLPARRATKVDPMVALRHE